MKASKRYAIRIKDLMTRRDESGFLGTADDSHLVRSAVDARHFPTIASAKAEIARLAGRPRHFLADSRSFIAYVVLA